MKFKKFTKMISLLTAAVCVLTLTPAETVLADETRSVYTNEVISPEAALTRPIAIMMPTDKVAQPSYGISHAKILYEIMEEGNISRQMAIIDDWQGLSKIGNIRSCRAYYIPQATEWDPILIHFGGVVYMKDRISLPDINNISGTYEYGTGGEAPGAGVFFRTSDRKAPNNAYISANGITKAAGQLGYSLTVRPEFYNAKHFTFAAGVNTLEQYGEGAAVANTIDLSDIFPYTRSGFTYDAAAGVYKKTIHGKAQVDGNNGQQLAFANTIECVKSGASFLDVTVNGLGRGAGNCAAELLAGYLMGQGADCSEEPFIQFIEKHVLALKKKGVVWGYDIPYLLTGQKNKHPSKAIEFIKEQRTKYTDFLRELAG